MLPNELSAIKPAYPQNIAPIAGGQLRAIMGSEDRFENCLRANEEEAARLEEAGFRALSLKDNASRTLELAGFAG